MDVGVTESGFNVTLTIWLLMHGKEVGSILGKKGESVEMFREESGPRIHISEGNCPERIIRLTGPTNAIFKAFTMIIDELEEDINSSMTNSTAASGPPVTLLLVVPATQCGSLIGKGGCKIKEIRESTGGGVQVQVAGVRCPTRQSRLTPSPACQVCEADLPGHAGDALPVSTRESHDHPVPAHAGQLASHLRGRPRSLQRRVGLPGRHPRPGGTTSRHLLDSRTTHHFSPGSGQAEPGGKTRVSLCHDARRVGIRWN